MGFSLCRGEGCPPRTVSQSQLNFSNIPPCLYNPDKRGAFITYVILFNEVTLFFASTVLHFESNDSGSICVSSVPFSLIWYKLKS